MSMDDYYEGYDRDLEFAKKVATVKVDEDSVKRVKDYFYKSYKNDKACVLPSLEGTNECDYEKITPEQTQEEAIRILAEEKLVGGLMRKEIRKGGVVEGDYRPYSDGICEKYNPTTNYEHVKLTPEQEKRIFQTLKMFESKQELPHPKEDTLSIEEIMRRTPGYKSPEQLVAESVQECEIKPSPKINQIIVFYLNPNNEEQYFALLPTLPDTVKTMLISVPSPEQCRVETIKL